MYKIENKFIFYNSPHYLILASETLCLLSFNELTFYHLSIYLSTYLFFFFNLSLVNILAWI